MALIAQVCLLSASAPAAATLAKAASSPALTVVSVWSRATAPGATVGVAYFEIVNAGAADVLTAIETPVAQRVEMHSMNTVDGFMQMRLLPAVAVPAAGRVQFMPGGLHAMLIDLKQPLREGDHFPLTLVFAHAGRVRVEARIEGLGALAPAAAQDGTAAEYRLAQWPRQRSAPDFRLLDVTGRARTLTDYHGSIVVLFFGFVRCPDACPAELFKLALVMKKLGALSARIQVLFVTLDPRRDTPDILQKYVSAFDPRFVALRGTPVAVDRAASAFFVQYARVGSGGDYTIDHSTESFVIDAQGRLRLVGTMDTSVDDFAHDLRVLALQ